MVNHTKADGSIIPTFYLLAFFLDIFLLAGGGVGILLYSSFLSSSDPFLLGFVKAFYPKYSWSSGKIGFEIMEVS